MELKAPLKDYTEPEFQALVDRIWAVDLPKQDHDRLINHFDSIVGHPKGADLLFYPPEDDTNTYSSGSVVYYVKDWYHKQNRAAFKGEEAPVPRPVVARPGTPLTLAQMTQQRIAHNLADVQKAAVDLVASERAAELALNLFEQRIKHLRQRQSAQVDIHGREADIRALEVAEFEARLAARRYEYWKMSLTFKRDSARRDLSYARSEHAQWQNIAHQINVTYDRYLTKLNDINQRLHRFQVDAEALLVATQTQLVDQRYQQGTGPNQASELLFAPLAFANARPGILLDGGLSQPLEIQRVALQKAIRSAVAEFTWQITSGAQDHQGHYAAVLQFDFSSRAEVGRYGLSVPLLELLPIEGQDWQGMAATGAEVNLPFRMSSGTYSVPPGTMSRGLREIKTLLQVAITPTNGGVLSSRVRVRAAVWNEHLKTYCFTADGPAPMIVSWSAPANLEAILTLAPAPEYRLGFLRSLPVPVLESFSDMAAIRFDDYVVVFPPASGLDPLYIVFRDRREYPEMIIAEAKPDATVL
ncbi:bacteriocin immunity protein [Pseudomonas sp. MDT1-85]